MIGFNLPADFCDNYALIYYLDSNMSDLAERSKVSLDLWAFSKVINISSDFDFSSFQYQRCRHVSHPVM